MADFELMENIILDVGRGTKHITERGQTLGTLNLDVVGRQWEPNLPIRNFAFSHFRKITFSAWRFRNTYTKGLGLNTRLFRRTF